MLRAIAQDIDDRASDMARTRIVVQHAPVERDRYRDTRDDRAWRGSLERREFWCVLDATSQRALLEFVLAGPPAPTLTAVERTIVADALLRLFDEPSGLRPVQLREETQARPSGEFWRCNVELCSRAANRVTLQTFLSIEDPPPPPRTAALEIGAVPIHIAATLPPMRVRLADVLGWQTRSLLRLEFALDDLTAEISADGARLAQAKLGATGAKRALQVTCAGSAWTT